jgi:hypothetical protein
VQLKGIPSILAGGLGSSDDNSGKVLLLVSLAGVLMDRLPLSGFATSSGCQICLESVGWGPGTQEGRGTEER